MIEIFPCHSNTMLYSNMHYIMRCVINVIKGLHYTLPAGTCKRLSLDKILMTDFSLFRSGSRHGDSIRAGLCVLQCDCCMDVILPLHVIPSRFTVEHLYKLMEHTQMCWRGDVNRCRGQYQFLGEWNKYNSSCLFCQQCHYQCYKNICFIEWRILGVSKYPIHCLR